MIFKITQNSLFSKMCLDFSGSNQIQLNTNKMKSLNEFMSKSLNPFNKKWTKECLTFELNCWIYSHFYPKNRTSKTQRLKILEGWLLDLGLKEGLVECTIVCVKSWVILTHLLWLLQSDKEKKKLCRQKIGWSGGAFLIASLALAVSVWIIGDIFLVCRSKLSKQKMKLELEPVCFKKQQKKFMTSYWFAD